MKSNEIPESLDQRMEAKLDDLQLDSSRSSNLFTYYLDPEGKFGVMRVLAYGTWQYFPIIAINDGDEVKWETLGFLSKERGPVPYIHIGDSLQMLDGERAMEALAWCGFTE